MACRTSSGGGEIMTDTEFEMKALEILRSVEDPQKAFEIATEVFNIIMAEE